MGNVLQLKENVFQLPSRGEAYDPNKVALLPDGSIKIRPMVVGDKRHLAGMSGTNYQIYYSLISRIIVEPKSLPLDELLMDDVIAILFAMRLVSFGSEYKLSDFQCENCGSIAKGHMCSLTDLMVKTVDDVEDFQADNLSTSLGGRDVVFHLDKMKDEKAVDRHLRTLDKLGITNNSLVDRIYVRYAQSIDSVDGKQLAIQEKMEFIDGLTQAELDKFAELKVTKSIGIDTNTSVVCSKCQYDNEVRVTINPEFFRT